MGFEKLHDFVELYNQFSKHLHDYLLESNHIKTEKDTWKSLYQTRAMEICVKADYYWIFLDTYKSTQIWDLYYYMEDVIKQIENYDESIKPKIHMRLMNRIREMLKF